MLTGGAVGVLAETTSKLGRGWEGEVVLCTVWWPLVCLAVSIILLFLLSHKIYPIGQTRGSAPTFTRGSSVKHKFICSVNRVLAAASRLN